MTHRLEPIATEEGTVELLQRMVRDGYCTLEDLDEPSLHWKYNEEFATQYHPSLEQRPHRNLLRESTINDTTVDVVETANRLGISSRTSQVLRPEKKALCTEVDLRRCQKEQLPSELPF